MALLFRLRTILPSASTNYFRGNRRRFLYAESAAYDYCITYVKKHDYDSYLAGLLMPRELRPHFFALRAFNAEVAQVKDQTKGNPLTARMRFQWWRELLEEAFSSPLSPSSLSSSKLDHPVAAALVFTARHHSSSSSPPLRRRWLERLLESRQADASSSQPPASLSALETYCEQSCSSALYLILDLMNVQQDAADRLASHVGVAAGLVTSLRSIPFLAAQVNKYTVV